MLPAAFNVRIVQKVRRTGNDNVKCSQDEKRLLSIIPQTAWIELRHLKKQISGGRMHGLLESLEDKGIVEIERTSDRIIRKKTVHMLEWQVNKQPENLTVKQEIIYRYLKDKNSPVSLSDTVELVSRSVIRSLEKKGYIRLFKREISLSDMVEDIIPEEKKSIQLTSEQQEILTGIWEIFKADTPMPILLYGVTGSGKTEIYIQVIRRYLHEGKSALLLVPEISLTPQMVSRFYSEFGHQVAILHSKLNARDRWKQWKLIRSGEKKIVIGVRSAIFAPLVDPGIILIDEEHENTYKQEQSPRYQARDLAVVRGMREKAGVILGSATPSLESWLNAANGKYHLQKLMSRPFDLKLPQVAVIDMRKETDLTGSFSGILIREIEERLDRKEQVILLQNRRGHSSFVQCLSCGKLLECPRCDISLNFHSSNAKLVCHYCGYTRDLPRKCPACNSYLFRFGAPGTQQIEKQLKLLFPEARILRMDSDIAISKKSYDYMFESMRSGRIDILLGTQMIAKGLDFPGVTLVGVVSADVSLNIPDFRAAERTFQLLTQVAGRSGRSTKAGTVLIQTYVPEHYAIRHAINQDFESFAREELQYRERLFYPPYFRITRLIFSSEYQELLLKEMDRLGRLIRKIRQQTDEEVVILGPVPTPLVKLNRRYRYHIIIKSRLSSLVSHTCALIEENLKLSNRVRVNIDVDPMNLL
ncbi:MAG: primosomal protein N', partial [Candidatus Cloacimonetes bacterium]|nr:primosomal protein N' [Candidatus Cloacimonadota bacterium]